MTTKPTSARRKEANPDCFDLPGFDYVLDFPSLAAPVDLPGLDCDFAEIDKLLGLGAFAEPLIDLDAFGAKPSRESPKNARRRDMGCPGDGARKSKPLCGAKTRTGKPCQAPGNGGGGRCKMHGGMSTGPKTPEGKARSLAALRSRHAR